MNSRTDIAHQEGNIYHRECDQSLSNDVLHAHLRARPISCTPAESLSDTIFFKIVSFFPELSCQFVIQSCYLMRTQSMGCKTLQLCFTSAGVNAAKGEVVTQHTISIFCRRSI